MSAMKKILSGSVLCLIFALFCFTAFAPLSASAEDDNSISLICSQESEPVKNMKWKIYKVGENSGGNFVLTGDYKSFPINLRDMSADNISGSAKALEGHIIDYQLPSLSETYTDAQGTAVFHNLDAALYLAIPQSVINGISVHKSEPFFFEVTNTGYESTLFPKIYSTATLTDTITCYTVKKVWADQDNAAMKRPVNVTVNIFKNAEPVETVILSEDNSWTYSWYSDEPDADWRVAEHYIPQKYEVYIDYNSTQYLIRNTYNPDLTSDSDIYSPPSSTTSTTTSSPSLTTSTSTDDSASFSVIISESSTVTSTTVTTTDGYVQSSRVTDNVSSTSNTRLPQTGQLWWPIPPLLGGGFTMLFAGLLIKPSSKKDEEDD